MKTKPDHRKIECPTCFYEMDCSSPVTGPKTMPADGDVSVCLRCGEILLFDNAPDVRLPTEDELAGIRQSAPTAFKAQQLIRKYQWVRKKEANKRLPL